MNFKDLLPKWWSIVIWVIIALSIQGCYTQLSMFYPEPEIEEVEEQFYETYSRAVPRPLNLSIYAQDGAGTPLSLAYSSMYNRFQPYYGFGYGYGRSGYYNSYGTYYGYDSYLIGGYTMYIPVNTGERKIRTFSTSRDSDSSPETNLNITRSNHVGYNRDSGNSSNSSNISSTRNSSGGTSSSSSSSGGRRVTRRH